MKNWVVCIIIFALFSGCIKHNKSKEMLITIPSQGSLDYKIIIIDDIAFDTKEATKKVLAKLESGAFKKVIIQDSEKRVFPEIDAFLRRVEEIALKKGVEYVRNMAISKKSDIFPSN